MESWSVLRHHFRLAADTVATMITTYVAGRGLVAPTEAVYRQVLQTARTAVLAGNIHDAVIVRTAERSPLRLTTLDAGLHRLAEGVVACHLLPRTAPG